MPEILEREKIDRRTVAPQQPPTDRRPLPQPRRPSPIVRWLGWLTAIVVVVGGGWWSWNAFTGDEVPAPPSMTGDQLDRMHRATTGYGAVGAVGIPTVGMWDYVRSIEEKDYLWTATAEHLGYMVEGLWISADGETWEHISMSGARTLPTTGMWDYVRSVEEKDYLWTATAEHLGYTVRGLWISADGLTWEHMNGSVVTVSTP